MRFAIPIIVQRQSVRWIALLVLILAAMGVLEQLPAHGQPLLKAMSAWSTPAALLIATLFVITVLWKLPRWQVRRSQGLTPENRFDRENEARKTLAQIPGGIVTIVGLYSTSETLRISQEGQLTERYARAIEQLGLQIPREIRRWRYALELSTLWSELRGIVYVPAGASACKNDRPLPL